MIRRPIQIFRLERYRENALAGLLERDSLGSGRRKRLYSLDNGILAHGEENASFPSWRVFLVNQPSSQRFLVYSSSFIQIPEQHRDMRSALDSQRMLVTRIADGPAR